MFLLICRYMLTYRHDDQISDLYILHHIRNESASPISWFMRRTSGMIHFLFAPAEKALRRKNGILVLVAFLAALTPTALYAQSQTLNLNLQAAAALYSFPNSLSLSKSGTVFDAFTGSLTINYKARTGTGTYSITMRATSDFPATGGPSIGAPPSSGDALTYTCTGATLGTGCSGTQTVVTTSPGTPVVTIPTSSCTGGGSPCSSSNPNTVTLIFSLTDDPKYKTGSYSATLTFTISTP
jgi:hypothetical protein